MRMKIVLLIITLMISVQATTASGMGIGVSPGNMSFKLAPETSAEQLLYVINTGNETAKYDVFVDGSTYKNWFTFSPSSFYLIAGEQKEVKVTLNAPASAEANAECKIKIPCTVSGSVVGTGIIIPVHIEIRGNNSDAMFNFIQDVNFVVEKLKDSAENLKVIGTKSLDDAAKSVYDIIKILDEKYPGALAEIKNDEEKFRALPGFDAPLAGAGLVISGLIMRRRFFN
jgi:hypothetical protein